MAFGNTSIIVGNTTRDPEVRFTDSGMAVCNLGVAWNQKRGDEEVAHFFDVVCFGSLAENVAESVTKGQRVIVVGRAQYRTYESKKFTDENGNHANLRAIEFVADNVGPDLNWASATVTRNERDGSTSNGKAEAQLAAAGVPDGDPF